MHNYYKYTEDLLSRSESAEDFVNDFLNTRLDYVIGLNSEYGSGKSVFIQMCTEYIDKNHKDIETVVINAAENEFEDNPSFTILSGIISKINTNDNINDVEMIGRLLLDMTARENITLDSDSLSIKNYLLKNRVQTKEQFEYKMKDLLFEKKIIVFLDDLDRCSPYFAIRILEELKYYFKFIIGITFVIAYDRKQLESFIKVKFGNNIDTNGYLAKFFDLRYFFKSVDKKDFVNNLFIKCSDVIECENLKDKFKTISEILCQNKEMLELLSLRDLQQLVFKIVYGLAKYKDIYIDENFSDAMILLSYLRILDWELYMDFYRYRLEGNKVREEMNNNNCFMPISDATLGLLSEDLQDNKNPNFLSKKRLRQVFDILENDRGEHNV